MWQLVQVGKGSGSVKQWHRPVMVLHNYNIIMAEAHSWRLARDHRVCTAPANWSHLSVSHGNTFHIATLPPPRTRPVLAPLKYQVLLSRIPVLKNILFPQIFVPSQNEYLFLPRIFSPPLPTHKELVDIIFCSPSLTT